MLPEFLETLEGTPFVVLKNDPRHGAWAKEHGDLIKEKELFEIPEVKALKQLDSPVVLDIGAGTGDTALGFIQLGCQVWAFEPYTDAYTALCINCPEARKLNVAVGDGSPLFPSGQCGEPDGNMGARMMGVGGKPSFKIDDIEFERVDFIKEDTEGCTVFALRGMTGTIKKHKPVLLTEVYDGMLAAFGFKRQDVLDLIESFGYSWRVAVGTFEEERCDLLCTPK